jgi:aminoglycoside 6'-N-acetyltransferase
MEVPSRGDSIRGEHTRLRHAVGSDLDLLTLWFADPDVYRWWGGEQIGRDSVRDDYTGHRSPAVECFIVEADGSPIGFLQYWHATGRSGGVDISLSWKRGDGDWDPTQPEQRRSSLSTSAAGPR